MDKTDQIRNRYAVWPPAAPTKQEELDFASGALVEKLKGSLSASQRDTLERGREQDCVDCIIALIRETCTLRFLPFVQFDVRSPEKHGIDIKLRFPVSSVARCIDALDDPDRHVIAAIMAVEGNASVSALSQRPRCLRAEFPHNGLRSLIDALRRSVKELHRHAIQRTMSEAFSHL